MSFCRRPIDQSKKRTQSNQAAKSPSQKRRKEKEAFRFPSKEEAQKALSSFNGNEMVKVANVSSENCCALVSYLNALRSYQERLAFVGGLDWIECPTAYFRHICGSPENGYDSTHYSRFFQKLVQNGALSRYILKKLKGYRKDEKSGQYYFHASDIFKLQRGTTLLFFGYSLPKDEIPKYRSILCAKRDYYQQQGYGHLAVQRMLEVYSNDQVDMRGSLLFELKKAYVECEEDQHPHVCAISVDKDGCIYKYDNSNEREREKITGLQDLLPYIFEYWATYVIKMEVKKD